MRENEKDEPSSFYFCWVARWGNHSEHLSRASHDTHMALVQNALIPWFHPHPHPTSLPPLSFMSLHFSPSPSTHMHMLTSLTQCCPQAWLLTDAGWECRAQLGLIAAVYLIKTWEDPTGARTREDTGSIYRVVHRCTHTHTHTSTSQESKEYRCFDLSSETIPFLPYERLCAWVCRCKACVCGCVFSVRWIYF